MLRCLAAGDRHARIDVELLRGDEPADFVENRPASTEHDALNRWKRHDADDPDSNQEPENHLDGGHRLELPALAGRPWLAHRSGAFAGDVRLWRAPEDPSPPRGALVRLNGGRCEARPAAAAELARRIVGLTAVGADSVARLRDALLCLAWSRRGACRGGCDHARLPCCGLTRGRIAWRSRRRTDRRRARRRRWTSAGSLGGRLIGRSDRGTRWWHDDRLGERFGDRGGRRDGHAR